MNQNISLFKHSNITNETLPQTMTLVELESFDDNAYIAAVQSLTQRADHLENTIMLLSDHSDLLESTLENGGQGLNEQGAVLSRLYVEKLMDDLGEDGEQYGNNMFGATQSYTDAGTRAANTAAAVQSNDGFIVKALKAFVAWIKKKIASINNFFSGKGSNGAKVKSPTEIKDVVLASVNETKDLIKGIDGKKAPKIFENKKISGAFNTATDHNLNTPLKADYKGAISSIDNTIATAMAITKVVGGITDFNEELSGAAKLILDNANTHDNITDKLKEIKESTKTIIIKAVENSDGGEFNKKVKRGVNYQTIVERTASGMTTDITRTLNKPIAGIATKGIAVISSKTHGTVKVMTMEIGDFSNIEKYTEVETLTEKEMLTLCDKIKSLSKMTDEMNESIKTFYFFEKAVNKLLVDFQRAFDNSSKTHNVSRKKEIQDVYSNITTLTNTLAEILKYQRLIVIRTAIITNTYIKKSVEEYV